MDQIMGIVSWISSHQAVLYGALFAVSEVLALVPGVSGNGVFDAVFKFLKAKQAA